MALLLAAYLLGQTALLNAIRAALDGPTNQPRREL